MSSAINLIRDRIAAGNSTARTEVEKALRRIDDTTSYNIVIATLTEPALKRADEIDAAIAAGTPVGRLAGVPFVAKDNFLVFGSDTTAASNILKGFKAPYQATAINKLEAEGAICVAKVNLDAFAHGSSTENSDFGPTKNPVNPEYVPGGSSGGSATAVALDIVPFALGTDTGGSIRLPASYCGVVGLKPTYGLVSRYGVVAMASSTDVIGPLTKSAEDAAIILDILAGKDERDGTTLPDRSESYLIEPTKPLRIGVVKEYMAEGVDPATRSRVQAHIDRLKSLEHTISEVSIPSVKLALAIYYVVVPAEVSSNLARYDGIKYGHRSDQANNLEETYSKSRAEGFNAENIRRIMIGNYVLSSGYYDAYYRKAQTARTLLINEFAKAFEQFDVLVGPTGPGPAFKLGAKKADPLQMYLVDIMTVAASMAGLSAISIPSGLVDGLPVGTQLIAPQRGDRLILNLAAQLEGQTS
ncbi:MAG TPA: Asp-tRNA(Asn)/Glu-tRNA(Gln) amidotransferase subunit GatA [Candidatus Saccharimonadales bacterium]|jgi:aspartyl-tRNA(Asn)/glutamyl-tRNA(Gln) amidotransferase subunit A|nr:Asp-tRNA(Asn)/Glu-tRNA(Gln) amidotransferase subunit GatA [Candidatus Saccharimonadales bacterium]